MRQHTRTVQPAATNQFISVIMPIAMFFAGWLFIRREAEQ